MERPPALGCVRLEVVPGLLDRRCGQLLELDLELRDLRALLVACRFEALRIRSEACLGDCEEVALLVRQALDLLRQPSLAPLEVAGPGGDALLDPPLDLDEGLAEAAARLLLPLRDGVPALLRDAALLLGDPGDRLGTRDGERLLELCVRALISASRAARTVAATR